MKGPIMKRAMEWRWVFFLAGVALWGGQRAILVAMGDQLTTSEQLGTLLIVIALAIGSAMAERALIMKQRLVSNLKVQISSQSEGLQLRAERIAVLRESVTTLEEHLEEVKGIMIPKEKWYVGNVPAKEVGAGDEVWLDGSLVTIQSIHRLKAEGAVRLSWAPGQTFMKHFTMLEDDLIEVTRKWGT